MKTNQTKLIAQWKKFLELPSAENRFTRDLYDYMYILPGFIAHFNREGFVKARFWTLQDFDLTLATLEETGSFLLTKVDADLIANARYKIAATECAVKMQQSRILIEKCEQLQREFTKKLY